MVQATLAVALLGLPYYGCTADVPFLLKITIKMN
jgi:hypothetical protein